MREWTMENGKWKMEKGTSEAEVQEEAQCKVRNEK